MRRGLLSKLINNTMRIMRKLKETTETLYGSRPYSLLLGDCQKILCALPDETVDCVITSPPYLKQRDYDVEEADSDSIIGEEDDSQEYVNRLRAVFAEVKRVLKQEGSLWLNLGDKYHNKNLMWMPWRVALALQEDGWILRNDVIWEKIKGTQSAKDRLRGVYEHLFHFVKDSKYYYDYEKILIEPRLLPTVNETSTISATGVSGKKYRQQIQESTQLTERERKAALKALDETLEKIRQGEIVDFRMTIRGNQRTLHSNNGKISGRAKELEQKGFFILSSHAKGYMPSDIWRIVPEDIWRGDEHYAVFPIELLERPIRATCPENGVVLDPFMGTGSTIAAAVTYGRRGIGIDLSRKYLKVAKERL